MDDDLNSPMVISALFDWVRRSTSWPTARRRSRGRRPRGADGHLCAATLSTSWACATRSATGTASGRDYVTPLVEMLLDERLKTRAAKDWAASDRIRDGLTAAGIRVKDRKDGTDWELE